MRQLSHVLVELIRHRRASIETAIAEYRKQLLQTRKYNKKI